MNRKATWIAILGVAIVVVIGYVMMHRELATTDAESAASSEALPPGVTKLPPLVTDAPLAPAVPVLPPLPAEGASGDKSATPREPEPQKPQ